jgi:hybrid cluster-associated redox disulfide protein
MSTDCSRLTTTLAVSELLNCWPETFPVFFRHRMVCAGCPMSQFETVEGAAAVYGLNLDSFMHELQQFISNQEVEE